MEFPRAKLHPSPLRSHAANVSLSSTGAMRCFMPMIMHLRVCLEDHEPGSMTPVDISWRCAGVPPDSGAIGLNAYQQLEAMNDIVAARLAIDVDGKTFADKDDLAQKVADAIETVRDELAKHVIIESTSVFTSLQPSSNLSDEAIDGLAEGTSADNSQRRDSVMESTSMLAEEDAVNPAALTQLIRQLDQELSAAASPQDEQAERISESHAVAQTAERRMQRGVVVALGSNVGNKIEEIEKACRAIDADPDMRIVDTSCLYETKPMYVEDQERFVNGACEVSSFICRR